MAQMSQRLEGSQKVLLHGTFGQMPVSQPVEGKGYSHVLESSNELSRSFGIARTDPSYQIGDIPCQCSLCKTRAMFERKMVEKPHSYYLSGSAEMSQRDNCGLDFELPGRRGNRRGTIHYRLRSMVIVRPSRTAASVTETVHFPIWHQAPLFILALACFAAEWYIRLRKGLP